MFLNRCLFLTAACLYFVNGVLALEVYTIDVQGPHPKPIEGHLKLGGSNPSGETYGVNNFYISKNGKPVLPVVGEFHFSRFPAHDWEQSLRKMKAGGIDIVATYVFWNVHEEKEGIFDWSGQRNLRRYAELCDKVGLPLIVRIGPFGHGEIRNGGLPDWLYGMPINIRSNDPGYLRFVDRFYREIGRQLTGQMFKDGGPVIGIQLENEFQHSAAPWSFSYPGQPHEWTAAEHDLELVMKGVGVQSKENPYASAGVDHLAVLKQLAAQAGLIAPIYTATGWGNAAILEDQCIPVTAAYAYPTWAKKEPSPFYLYKDIHTEPDYSPVRYDATRYPSFAAELSGGIMVTYDRRPTVPPESLEALVVRVLGSGSNGIGYYMYHGGSTPRGQREYLSDEAIGVPKISYDFQAPIGEFGDLRESFHRLKLLHFFLNDFGSTLAPMVSVLPENAGTMKPTDVGQLRYAARVRDNSGFVFMHNYQDHVRTPDIEDFQIAVQTEGEEIRIPTGSSMTLRSGDSLIIPFNLDLDGVTLKYATAQPLMRLRGEDTDRYVFVAMKGTAPEFAFVDRVTLGEESIACELIQEAGVPLVRCKADTVSEFSVTRESGERLTVLVIPKTLALQAWKVDLEGERLCLSSSTVLQHEDYIEVLSLDEPSISLTLYPALRRHLSSHDKQVTPSSSDLESMSEYHIDLPPMSDMFTAVQSGRRNITVSAASTPLPESVNEVFIDVDYQGDVGMAFLDGELVTDHFYFGQPWRIGLKRFLPTMTDHQDMYLKFRPLYKEAPFLSDLPEQVMPDFAGGNEVISIEGIQLKPEYRVLLGL